MTAENIKSRLEEMASHFTFRYKGKDCGVDPISCTHFDVWYGDIQTVFHSVDEVMQAPFFDGDSLGKIAVKITVIDW